MKLFFLICAFLTVQVAQSSKVRFEGGGQAPENSHDVVSEFESMNRWYRYIQDREKLIQQGKTIIDKSAGAHAMYDFPLKSLQASNGYYGISNFVDQNSDFPDQLLDYNGGVRTYDLNSGYNHQGIDYFTWPNPWYKMDNDLVQVVAAEAGTITTKIDGNYDRSCGFNDPNNQGWNAVYITHSDGSYAFYGHMKSGSLTNKTIGETVEVGEYLGIVGSSGTSTGPHLHFETFDSMNNLVEPYFGPFNNMNNDSWWRNQPPYYESQINQMMTLAVAPQILDCTVEGQELTNEEIVFSHNEQVYLAVYYRDQLSSQVTNYQVIDPSGSIVANWSHSSNAAHYAASYWYWTIPMPSSGSEGRWTFRANYEGDQKDHYFWLGDNIFTNGFE